MGASLFAFYYLSIARCQVFVFSFGLWVKHKQCRGAVGWTDVCGWGKTTLQALAANNITEMAKLIGASELGRAGQGLQEIETDRVC